MVTLHLKHTLPLEAPPVFNANLFSKTNYLEPLLVSIVPSYFHILYVVSFHQSFRLSSLLPDSPQAPTPTDPSACPPTPPALPLPVAVVGGNGGREAGKYCCLCGAWFNNPLMAQQHYEGKKHRRNAARARLLEQLAGSLDATESTGQPRGRARDRQTTTTTATTGVLGPCVRKDDEGRSLARAAAGGGGGVWACGNVDGCFNLVQSPSVRL